MHKGIEYKAKGSIYITILVFDERKIPYTVGTLKLNFGKIQFSYI